MPPSPPLSVLSLSCSFPLCLSLTHLSLPPLPPSMPFSSYQNDKFAVGYTHASVPGSSDTSGDSGGRRPRKRSEIRYKESISNNYHDVFFLSQ